jgi:hypothetical protein
VASLTVRIIFALGSVGLMSYEMIKIRAAFASYPQPVQESLAKAIYFSYFRKDDARAMKYYQEALYGAQEAGLHPLSDGVIGIKGQLAHYLEEKEAFQAAADIYKAMEEEMLDWLKTTEDSPDVSVEERMRVFEKAVGCSAHRSHCLQGDENKEERTAILEEIVSRVLRERKRLQDKGIDDVDFNPTIIAPTFEGIKSKTKSAG